MTRRLLPCLCCFLGLILFFSPIVTRAADNWVEARSAHFTVITNDGLKQAQKVADQFEQIRLMFHTQFTTLDVDPAQPIIIIAAKNENTLKLYLPEEYEVKGHIHHAGLYQAGQDKDYVIMRLDMEGANPFHVLYHEYTHALVRLNFNRLPLWLNEGLADFFGNTTLGEKEIRTGTIDPSHLYILGQRKLIPIDVLLQVDHNSPYYNETDHANVFYAESWALVHYLMMDPDARQKQLLKTFLDSFEKSGDQVAAAREAFGDLKKFGEKIESYTWQRSFMVGIVKLGQEKVDKNYQTRTLTPGEVLAVRGDFFAHHNRLEQAAPVIDEAIKEEPNLPLGHTAKGFCYYRTQKTREADDEMQEAIKLGATDFAPYYFHGVLLERNAPRSENGYDDARVSLEKAIQLNPKFAPAYEALSHAYGHTKDAQILAVNAAIKAVKLDPGTIHYAVSLTYLLINNGRTKEAQTMVTRVSAQASSPMEKQMAANLQQTLNQRIEWEARKQAGGQVVVGEGGTTVSMDGGPTGGSTESADTPVLKKRSQLYAMDGAIAEANCSKRPEVTLSLAMQNGPISFHAADYEKVAVTHADGITEPSVKSCDQWKGRQVKVWFSPTPGKQFVGEIAKMYFF
jgi:tetratricopeptide (TPR) repeat protein